MSTKVKLQATQKTTFLEAMLRTFGNVTAAAKALGISRSTPYKWAATDPIFARQFSAEVFGEMLKDAIEAKLAKVGIQDENPTVLIFLAKTKCKDRGYVEKTEHELKARVKGSIDYSKLSDSALREISEQTDY